MGYNEKIKIAKLRTDSRKKLMEIAVKQRNAKREISGERAKFYQEELAQSKADIENIFS